MNLQKHILFALVSPLMLSFSLPLETEEPTASNDSRPLSIRNLSENGAAFRDKSYYSNDDSSGQMLRLSSLINDANPRHGEEDNSVNVVEYLSGPNTMESLARSINDRLTIPAIYDGNTGIKDEDQDRQEVQAQVLQESITFFGIADTKAFPLFSYSYDTMPPTTNKELESPTPIFGISGPETASTGFAEPSDNLAPTVAMAADDDLLIIDESMDSTSRVPTQVPTSSATPTSTSRRSSKNRSRNTDGNMLGTNESKGYPMIRPQEEISVTNFDSTKSEPSTTAQADEVVHSPSLRPSVFQGTAIDIIEDVTCFPPCKETEEICRSRGKGGLGSCHPKCKSKKRCDFGDVCRSDGYCDRCRACKSFKKKKGCCSVDFEICREVIPEKKVDKCFSKCSYDKDCSDLVLPNSDDVCLLDGGCSRTKSKRKKNYDSYQKSSEILHFQHGDRICR